MTDKIPPPDYALLLKLLRAVNESPVGLTAAVAEVHQRIAVHAPRLIDAARNRKETTP